MKQRYQNILNEMFANRDSGSTEKENNKWLANRKKSQKNAAIAALKTQRGEYDGGKKGGAINRMALMKAKDLKKIISKKDKK
ncbi:MAG: hypothetical protein WD512_20240 [Candidatus Paceibacterota bacterium]